jgi:molecular chaperone DnaK
MSHSLGMVAESANRSCYVNSIIISKNKPIPSIETRPYQLHTARHQDNTLEVYMLQGESDIPTQCIILGQYTFSNITHIPNKPAIIDIEYAYDKNGVVKVSAKERATGRLLPMKEQKPSNMSWLADAPPKEIVIQVHLSVLIAVDLSGSMSDRPLEEAQKAAECFINQIDLSHASIGLMVFADKVLLSQPLCQNTKKLKQGINNWEETMNSAYVGWGNAAEPFSEALALLKKEEEPRFLIVLTDGVWYNQENAIRCAKKCHSNGIEVIAIGFGGADKDFLKQIATSDENALFTDLGNLVTSFSNIAQELTETSGGMQITESGQHRKTGLLSFFK